MFHKITPKMRGVSGLFRVANGAVQLGTPLNPTSAAVVGVIRAVLTRAGSGGAATAAAFYGTNIANQSSFMADGSASGVGLYQRTQLAVALAMNSSGTDWGLIQNDASNAWSLAHSPTFGGVGTSMLQWTTAALLGRGPVAAGLVDMTPDQASWTATPTGGTSPVTGTGAWFRIGKCATVYIPNCSIVSNVATFTITGLPAAVQPVRTILFDVPFSALENNGTLGVANGVIGVASGSGTLTLGLSSNTGSGGFTAASTKGIVNGGFAITYPLN